MRLFFSHHHHAGDPQVGQEDEGADGDGTEVDGHVAAELHGHVLKKENYIYPNIFFGGKSIFYLVGLPHHVHEGIDDGLPVRGAGEVDELEEKPIICPTPPMIPTKTNRSNLHRHRPLDCLHRLDLLQR